jgi:hypothetical protein
LRAAIGSGDAKILVSDGDGAFAPVADPNSAGVKTWRVAGPDGSKPWAQDS